MSERHHSVAWVGLFYLISLMILFSSALMLDLAYDDPHLAAAMLPYEVILGLVLAMGSLFVFDTRALGLRLPQRGTVKSWAPLGGLVVLAALAWGLALAQSSSEQQPGFWMQNLACTALVGWTEEWMYRGLLLAFFVHRWGARKGALTSLALFGLLHAMNMLTGVPASSALAQVMLTLFAGATFLWGTVSSGSLWPGVVGHAAYDFFLLDMRSFATEASAPFTLLPLGGVFLLGGYCLFRLFRLPADGEAMAFLADRQTSSAGASPR